MFATLRHNLGSFFGHQLIFLMAEKLSKLSQNNVYKDMLECEHCSGEFYTIMGEMTQRAVPA